MITYLLMLSAVGQVAASETHTTQLAFAKFALPFVEHLNVLRPHRGDAEVNIWRGLPVAWFGPSKVPRDENHPANQSANIGLRWCGSIGAEAEFPNHICFVETLQSSDGTRKELLSYLAVTTVEGNSTLIVTKDATQAAMWTLDIENRELRKSIDGIIGVTFTGFVRVDGDRNPPVWLDVSPESIIKPDEAELGDCRRLQVSPEKKQRFIYSRNVRTGK